MSLLDRHRGVVSLGAAFLLVLAATGPSSAGGPPRNDDVRRPWHLHSHDVGLTGTWSTLAATTTGEPVPSCGRDVGATIWFRFRPDAPMRLFADTAGSDFDTVLQVYVATASGLNRVDCNDDPTAGERDAALAFAAAAGKVYYFQLGGYDRQSGDAAFVLQGRPAHDAFGNAVVVKSLASAFESDLTVATVQSGEPPSACGTPARTVWYRYKPSSTGNVSVDTFGSYAHSATVVDVFRGTRLSSLVPIGCKNDPGGSGGLRFSWRADADRTYYIRVHATMSPGPLTVTFTRT